MGEYLAADEFRQRVVEYRDQAAILLQFAPSIEKLIDDEHCDMLSDCLRAHGREWEIRAATSNLDDSLPDEPGLYMFVWRPKLEFSLHGQGVMRPAWVLYVGQAGGQSFKGGTIKQRYRSEYGKLVSRDPKTLWVPTESNSRAALLRKFLTLRPLEYWYLILEKPRDTIDDSKSEIERFEMLLLRTLKPPLNTQHTRRLRVGQTFPVK